MLRVRSIARRRTRLVSRCSSPLRSASAASSISPTPAIVCWGPSCSARERRRRSCSSAVRSRSESRARSRSRSSACARSDRASVNSRRSGARASRSRRARAAVRARAARTAARRGGRPRDLPSRVPGRPSTTESTSAGAASAASPPRLPESVSGGGTSVESLASYAAHTSRPSSLVSTTSAASACRSWRVALARRSRTRCSSRSSCRPATRGDEPVERIGLLEQVARELALERDRALRVGTLAPGPWSRVASATIVLASRSAPIASPTIDGSTTPAAQAMIDSRSAIATACVRVSASSFARMWRTWLLTVSCEMNSLVRRPRSRGRRPGAAGSRARGP